MSKFNLEPIANTAFEPIVANTAWQDPAMPSRLRVAAGLGNWLVHVDENDQVSGLLGYSIENVDNEDPLLPPRNIGEVKMRLAHTLVVGLFNTDMTAKGIGSTMANIPDALQPNSIHGRVAVRSVPLTSESEIYRRPEADTYTEQKMRLARHGSLLMISAALDKVTRSEKGTLAAVRYMERGYGDAKLVLAPAPPIWQRQQHSAGIIPAIPPDIVLVRGGRFTESNSMHFVGSYPNDNS
ncbi:MAG: hypothetical protein AAB834_04770 [Patescibacteria group bacterium]